jgi:hypothetical protein
MRQLSAAGFAVPFARQCLDGLNFDQRELAAQSVLI